MVVVRLLTLDEAAKAVRVPRGSLETAAREHGYLIKMGRTVRINPNDIPELIKLCRNKPKDQDSTAAKTAAATTSSATPGAGKLQQAQETAERLKRPSNDTSPRKTGQAGQQHQIK